MSSQIFFKLLHPVVAHTVTQYSIRCLPDFRVSPMRGPVQHRLCRQNLPVLAKATVRKLLVNPGLLQRLQLAGVRNSFECSVGWVVSVQPSTGLPNWLEA